MEVPQLVRERLGDESVEGTVSLGDEDVVCVTPTRTFVYRGEGLLSDESVAVFSHDVEQFDVSDGRRKTSFRFEYVEGSDSFSVPGNRAGSVLKLLVGGILQVAGVIDDEESVSEVFTFSELTLVVTSHRLVKHVGAAVWDDDFEVYPYGDVTGLSFEEGSVATQVVLSVDGRPERIKAPSDHARKVERTLKQALFSYHGVDSLAALNEKVAPEDDQLDDAGDDDQRSAGSLALDESISPLVGGSDDGESDSPAVSETQTPDSPTDSETQTPDSSAASPSATDNTRVSESPRSSETRTSESAEPSRTDTQSADATGGREAGTGSGPTEEGSVETVSTRETATARSDDAAVDPEDIETIKKQLSTLATAVKKQNQLLRDQQETIDTLIEELRRGR